MREKELMGRGRERDSECGGERNTMEKRVNLLNVKSSYHTHERDGEVRGRERERGKRRNANEIER